MKNVILTILTICALSTTGYGQISAGAGLLYGTESELGFNIRGEYDITENISGVLSYSRLSSMTETTPIVGEVKSTLSTIDLDGHYHFAMEGFRPYVLVGLTNLRVSAKVAGISSSASETGFNVGGGINKPMGEKFNLFGEAKYSIVDEADQLLIIAGGKYSF